MTKSPVRVMREFMESLVAKNGIGRFDYQINAAMKNRNSA